MIIDSYGFSRKGAVRKNNQDSILLTSDGEYGIFLVADGVGGLYDGEKASALVRDTFMHWWYKNMADIGQMHMDEIKESIEQEMIQLNDNMYLESSINVQSASTAVVLMIIKDRYLLINVGDSRCYKIQTYVGKEKVLLLTKDDVWENLPDNINYNKEYIEHHKNFGKLTQAFGAMRFISPAISVGEIKNKDLFFLCSDGIYKICEEEVFYSELEQAALENCTINDTLNRLEECILRNGSRDNYSAIIIKIYNEES